MAEAEPSCLQTAELLKTFCRTVAPQLNKGFFFTGELNVYSPCEDQNLRDNLCKDIWCYQGGIDLLGVRVI